jgi:hypothetical protein
MVSVQNSGFLHTTVTWLMRDPESLPIIDNEIWLGKIHFNFWPEGIFLKIELLWVITKFARALQRTDFTLPHRDCYHTNWSFRPGFSFIFMKGIMHANDDAQMKKALLQIKGEAALGKVNVNTINFHKQA